MSGEIKICPVCAARYPPKFQLFLTQRGKCVFCDAPIVAFVEKKFPANSKSMLEPLPFFPHKKIDLDQLKVDLPFLERVFDILKVDPETRQAYTYAVKLELLRAQVKTEVLADTTPQIISDKDLQ